VSAVSCCCGTLAIGWRPHRLGRARSFHKPLDASDLGFPSLIRRALVSRRDLLSMSFDPNEVTGMRPEMTVATLELRSVVCLPLVRFAAAWARTRAMFRPWKPPSACCAWIRAMRPPISAKSRVAETLAIEASTILENARLLTKARQNRIETN
jgi:hypothetical protein